MEFRVGLAIVLLILVLVNLEQKARQCLAKNLGGAVKRGSKKEYSGVESRTTHC